MSAISSTTRLAALVLRTIRRPGRQIPAAPPAGASPAVDELEISNFARLMSRLRQIPDVRQERVQRLRAEIATGVYETEVKLDAALEAMLADQL
jgi:anti-sigma28 factor (negative regulator of flagellin synthesis)